MDVARADTCIAMQYRFSILLWERHGSQSGVFGNNRIKSGSTGKSSVNTYWNEFATLRILRVSLAFMAVRPAP
jgi:hypothetical protein